MEIGRDEYIEGSEKLKVHVAGVPMEWLAHPHGAGPVEGIVQASVPAVPELLAWALDDDAFSFGNEPSQERTLCSLEALIVAEAGGHLPCGVGILAQRKDSC